MLQIHYEVPGSAAVTSSITSPIIAQPAAAHHHRILPGQGKCLDGDEGRKVLHKFREFAATFPMPLTADAKKQLRARYIQMHIDAGGFVCVCPVDFRCTCDLFLCRYDKNREAS